MKSRMSREVQVRFCESVRVQFPRATRRRSIKHFCDPVSYTHLDVYKRQGFSQGATVKIGTLTITGAVVSADGTTITFTTPANLGKPGTYDVVVTNGNGQLATKTAGYTYFISVSFAPGANVTQGSDRGPRFVQPYDLDKDGTLDLAVAYANSSTLVTYKGTSAGTNISFGTANTRGVNTYPFMLSVGDVNGV